MISSYSLLEAKENDRSSSELIRKNLNKRLPKTMVELIARKEVLRVFLQLILFREMER